MESDLRTLAAQQELYFPNTLTYAGSVGDLTEFTESPGVSINITYADAFGWAAQATHPSLDSRSCGIFVGDAPAADGAPATTAGVITCD